MSDDVRPIKTNLVKINETLYLVDQLERQVTTIVMNGAAEYYIERSVRELKSQLGVLKTLQPQPDFTKMS